MKQILSGIILFLTFCFSGLAQHDIATVNWDTLYDTFSPNYYERMEKFDADWNTIQDSIYTNYFAEDVAKLEKEIKQYEAENKDELVVYKKKDLEFMYKRLGLALSSTREQEYHKRFPMMHRIRYQIIKYADEASIDILFGVGNDSYNIMSEEMLEMTNWESNSYLLEKLFSQIKDCISIPISLSQSEQEKEYMKQYAVCADKIFLPLLESGRDITSIIVDRIKKL